MTTQSWPPIARSHLHGLSIPFFPSKVPFLTCPIGSAAQQQNSDHSRKSALWVHVIHYSQSDRLSQGRASDAGVKLTESQLLVMHDGDDPGSPGLCPYVCLFIKTSNVRYVASAAQPAADQTGISSQCQQQWQHLPFPWSLHSKETQSFFISVWYIGAFREKTKRK